jgi:hypothetical protein
LPRMWRVLRFLGHLVLEFKTGTRDITWHGEIDITFDIVPIQC